MLYLPFDQLSARGVFKRLSDKSIIEGIRNQDDKVLNWVYDNYYQSVRIHITKNSGTADDVSDIFQDAVIVLYRQICDGNLSLTTDLKGYFFGIAKNLWSNQLRQKKETQELRADIPDESAHDDSTDHMLERVITRALEKLPAEFRDTLVLFSQGYSYEEIAKKMKLKNEIYARRKKYLSKEALMEKMKEDPEYQEYLRFRK